MEIERDLIKMTVKENRTFEHNAEVVEQWLMALLNFLGTFSFKKPALLPDNNRV